MTTKIGADVKNADKINARPGAENTELYTCVCVLYICVCVHIIYLLTHAYIYIYIINMNKLSIVFTYNLLFG